MRDEGRKEVKMFLRVLSFSFLLCFITCNMKIYTSQEYFIPNQTLKINCTSTIIPNLNLFEITIAINDQLVIIINKMSEDQCQRAVGLTGRVPCQDECKCAIDEKSISYVYNVSNVNSTLYIGCKDPSHPEHDYTKIEKAQTPNSIIINTSSPVKVHEREDVGPIPCEAHCVPDCTYRWTGPNNFTTNGSMLHIKNIKWTENGSYVCLAENVFGEAQDMIDIIVEYGPNMVSLIPSNLTYTKEEGQYIGPISCTSQCNPECYNTWTGPGISPTTGVLEIPSINRNQTGQFICTATNVFGTLQMTVNVTAQYGPSNLMISPQNLSYIVLETFGSVGPITCTADCRPKCTITWRGPFLPDGTSSELKLQNISRNQSGDYQCTANNSIHSLESGILKVIVNYGPSNIIITPQNLSYTVIESTGSVGPITCTADCRPKCIMTWSGYNQLPVITSELNLQNISRNQAGDYKCTASNPVGNETSAVIAVTVNYVPTIHGIEGDTAYSENDTAEFNCNVESIPKSAIKWKFMDRHSTKIFPDENEPIYKPNGKFLIISPISCLSTGVYRCEANNDVGVTQMDINVTVMCAPRLNSIECEIQDNVAVKENQPLNITAPVLAYPKPWISWKFFQNNSSINITQDIRNTYSLNRHFSYLYIQNLTQNDFGIYAVYAKNGVGNNTNYIGTFNVHAARKPNKPSNVTCSAGSNYITVNWQPEFHGGSPQSFKVFYTTIQSNSFICHPDNVSETAYHPVKIINLHSSSVYLLRVRAENIYNVTMSDVVHCNTTSQGDGKTESLIAVGVGLGLAFVVICVVLAIIFIFRRLQTKIPKNDTEPKKRLNEEVESDDLKDNPLYVSSADDVLHQSDVYSKSSKEKKKDKRNKPIELGCVYENADDIMKGNEQFNANQQEAQKDITINFNPRKNKDGLIYADLDLVPLSKGQMFVIHGMDNRNNYAIIDLSKKADPLPSDDEDEIVKSEENKN